MSIVDIIYSYLPAKHKLTPSGWTKFNAVCCQHNGTSADTRARGGFIRHLEGCSYHCFNCGYKTSYVTGRHITRKMRNLLFWLGIPDDIINKISLEALKIESDQREITAVTLPTFFETNLPDDARLLSTDSELQEWMIPAIEYVYSRGLTLESFNFYVSERILPERIIIPFYYEGKVVGYTARKLTDSKPKYLSEQTPGYVFNLDQQINKKFVIVVEGPIDAISISGVAILGADIMEKQAMLINRLGQTVVVVPDRDQEGQRTVERAIELGWAVSFPDWEYECKDANDAVRKYGKLYTIYSIIKNIEYSEIKIKLKAKHWFKKDN